MNPCLLDTDILSEVLRGRNQSVTDYADAYLLIAATALVHGRDLVTGNVAHFDWMNGLNLSNWRT